MNIKSNHWTKEEKRKIAESAEIGRLAEMLKTKVMLTNGIKEKTP